MWLASGPAQPAKRARTASQPAPDTPLATQQQELSLEAPALTTAAPESRPQPSAPPANDPPGHKRAHSATPARSGFNKRRREPAAAAETTSGALPLQASHAVGATDDPGPPAQRPRTQPATPAATPATPVSHRQLVDDDDDLGGQVHDIIIDTFIYIVLDILSSCLGGSCRRPAGGILQTPHGLPK